MNTELKSKTDALILCGGKATRLGGLNGNIPKSLLKINKLSLLSLLIIGIEEFVNEIVISYAGTSSPYKNCFDIELASSIRKRIVFLEDIYQNGTAAAVQQFHFSQSNTVSVLNGDTLFNNYKELFNRTPSPDEVVISTSRQPIKRSTVVRSDPLTKLISYNQNRQGTNISKGTVTNGFISFGKIAFNLYKDFKIENGVSLERSLLNSQTENAIKYSLHSSDSTYIDFGTPDEYLNPLKHWKILNGQIPDNSNY